MNKRILFVALFLALCGITYGVVHHKKPQTIIHAAEGIFSQGKLTLIKVSPKISYPENGKHGSSDIANMVKGWEGERKGSLTFKMRGSHNSSSLTLLLSDPVYDARRQLLSFKIETSASLPNGSFLEPTLQLD